MNALMRKGLFLLAGLLLMNQLAQADYCSDVYETKEVPVEIKRDSISQDVVECRMLTVKDSKVGSSVSLAELDFVSLKINADPNYSDQNLWGSIARLQMVHKVDCMKVVGEIRQCTCLSELLPKSISFSDYSLMILNPNANFSYLRKKPAMVSYLINKSREIREQCLPKK